MTDRVPKNWRLAYLTCKPEHLASERNYQIAKRVRFLAQVDEFKRTGSSPSNIVLTEELVAKFGAEAESWVDE